MVDTVLTRDKNWVRWKAEGCPPIEKSPVSIQDYLDTQLNASKVSTNKRLRSTPLGSLDLSFLSEDANLSGLERLKQPDRFTTPSVDSYMRGIAEDEFSIAMAPNTEEKEEAIKAKASKTWRTLRLASRSKLNLFDKIDDGKKLQILFEIISAPEGRLKPAMGVENGVGGGHTGSKDEEAKENLALPDESMPDQG
jgi:THO complex subunit 1